MPSQARHAATLVLDERGYRSITGGPKVWLSTAPHRAAHGPAGGWTGYFVNDAFPDAVFDLTEWIDRDHQPPVIGYFYQVRYCNALRGGVGWQYRLDYHPLDDPAICVAHYHDQETRTDEHDPRPWGRFLSLVAEALPVLEQHALTTIGPCSGAGPCA